MKLTTVYVQHYAFSKCSVCKCWKIIFGYLSHCTKIGGNKKQLALNKKGAASVWEHLLHL